MKFMVVLVRRSTKSLAVEPVQPLQRVDFADDVPRNFRGVHLAVGLGNLPQQGMVWVGWVSFKHL